MGFVKCQTTALKAPNEQDNTVMPMGKMMHCESPCSPSSKTLICIEAHLSHNAYLLSFVSQFTGTGRPKLLRLVSPRDEVYFYKFCHENIVGFMSDHNNCGKSGSGLPWNVSYGCRYANWDKQSSN
jgi:hypothetical protein